MDLKEELQFLRNLGLNMAFFGKDLRKLYRGFRDCNIFVVVTRPYGDELYHPDTLPEEDMTKLRNWIRCGDPTGLLSEWRDINVSSCNLKAYLAGENPSIDCTSVMDDMFANRGVTSYTYTLGRGAIKKTIKITHPQDSIDLGGHYDHVWKATKDFSDLINLNRRYLSDQIPNAPYYGGLTDNETVPLVPGLLKLNDFGLFTTDSHPYGHGVSESDGKRSEWEQRPHITFIMPDRNGLSLKLFNRLKERADVVVSAEEYFPFNIVDGSHGPHTVCRQRTADTVKDLETAEWATFTTVCSGSNMSLEDDLLSLNGMRSAKPVSFDVAASEWGVQLDLLGVIEEVAIDCGLPRIS